MHSPYLLKANKTTTLRQCRFPNAQQIMEEPLLVTHPDCNWWRGRQHKLKPEDC